jgi:hypothetical protein
MGIVSSLKFNYFTINQKIPLIAYQVKGCAFRLLTKPAACNKMMFCTGVEKIMKTKQLAILFSILVLLILLAVWQRRDVLFKSKQATDQSQLLFADFDPQAAARIELTKPDRQVILTRRDGMWLVSAGTAAPAEAGLVAQLLDRIGQITKGDITSQQPEKFGLFQVDASGLEVKVTDEGGKTLAHFYLGKLGPDFASLYLRKEGSNDTLLINQNLRPIFDRPDWRKKKVFDFEPQQVDELSLEYDDKRFSLIREGDEWRLVQPEEAKAKQRVVESMLNTLRGLRIIDYAEQAEPSKYGLDDPWLRIEAALADGTALELLAGNKKDEGAVYYAMRADEEYIFTLPVHQVDRLKRKLAELKEKEEKRNDKN